MQRKHLQADKLIDDYEDLKKEIDLKLKELAQVIVTTTVPPPSDELALQINYLQDLIQKIFLLQYRTLKDDYASKRTRFVIWLPYAITFALSIIQLMIEYTFFAK